MPSAEFRENKFLYYGNWPWSKRIFSMEKMTRASFSPHAPIWYGSRLLSLQLEDREVNIWLPNEFLFPSTKVREILRTYFAEKYTEQ